MMDVLKAIASEREFDGKKLVSAIIMASWCIDGKVLESAGTPSREEAPGVKMDVSMP
jgi:hypothetical protein